MKIILFSRYGTIGASSRLRSYQYLPLLKEGGIDVTPVPLFDSVYVTQRHNEKRDFASILSAYFKRILQIFQSHRFDLIWIEKELLPWLPSWFESYLYYRKQSILVDYDDAIFHKYDLNYNALVRGLLGCKIDRIMKKARMVTVGNHYLAKRAANAGAKRVEIIPTVIDLKRYPATPVDSRPTFTIGWVGSPTTAGYLKLIEDALVTFCRNFKARLVAVGAGKLTLSDEIPVDSLPWSEESEAAAISTFDVGVMPLPNSPWARGKCGYKLIQYMGCGRPVIASGVSTELEIVNDGQTGFLVDSQSQWIDRLERLYCDRDLAVKMGQRGRRLVAEQYCLQVTAPRLKSILKEAARIQ